MNNKLPKEAYGGVDGKEYVPYLSGKSNKGSNLAVMIIGIILAALFAVDKRELPSRRKLALK